MRSLTLVIASLAVAGLAVLAGCNSLTSPSPITITKDEAGAQPAPNAEKPAPKADGAAKQGAAPAQPAPAPRPAPAPAPQGGTPSCGG